VILVNLVNLTEASAKLELPFVDVQRFDPVVKGGWWDAQLSRRA